MKAFKYLSSRLVIGSFAAALIGFPLAANAEEGSERLRVLHFDRGFLGNNVVFQPVTAVEKGLTQSMTKDGSEHTKNFHKPRKGAYLKVRGR